MNSVGGLFITVSSISIKINLVRISLARCKAVVFAGRVGRQGGNGGREGGRDGGKTGNEGGWDREMEEGMEGRQGERERKGGNGGRDGGKTGTERREGGGSHIRRRCSIKPRCILEALQVFTAPGTSHFLVSSSPLLLTHPDHTLPLPDTLLP